MFIVNRIWFPLFSVRPNEKVSNQIKIDNADKNAIGQGNPIFSRFDCESTRELNWFIQ